MTNMAYALLFHKDYLTPKKTRYFLWDEAAKELSEKTADEVADCDFQLICHDYWLISSDIYISSDKKKLPPLALDLTEYHLAVTGSAELRRTRDSRDIVDLLSGCGLEQAELERYGRMVRRSEPLETAMLKKVGSALLCRWAVLSRLAIENFEQERYERIELPVFHYLNLSAAKGICINSATLRAHKEHLEHDYFLALKSFSAKYNLPLEVPSDDDIIEYLEPKGFDFTGSDVSYILQFVPTPDNYGADVVALRKLAQSRQVLAAIPLSKDRIVPMVDCFGSVTSRIYFRDPSLQNLAKRHRDIVCARPGMSLTYVDYDQYEVGIMAALSNDNEMLSLYAADDLYVAAAMRIFGDATKRRDAKRLFLSYAYGMSPSNLVDAATVLGARRADVKAFFKSFRTFEKWKQQVCDEFQKSTYVGTTLGNYRRRHDTSKLTSKERRSAVSQVVQGTASLIFKKALIELSKEVDISLKIPMHDAILVEHEPEYDVSRLVSLMSKTMTDHFSGHIVGKASIDAYFVPPT